MEIKILGSGCPKCLKLGDNTKQALQNLNINATVTKVTDYGKMMAYGIMSTPALVIDEKVISSGRLLSTQEIENILKNN